MVRALEKIRQMLSPEQDHRPRARDLWKDFDLANEKCRDCHPGSNTKWDPSDEQKVLHEEGQDHREQIMKKQEEKENRDKRLSAKFQLPTSHPAVPGSPTRKSFEKISRATDRTASSSAWPPLPKPDGTSIVYDFASRPRRRSLATGGYPDLGNTITDASILDKAGTKQMLSSSPPSASIKLVIQEPRRSSSPSTLDHRRYSAKSARPREVLDAVPDNESTVDGPPGRSPLEPIGVYKPRPRPGRAAKSYEAHNHIPNADTDHHHRPRSRHGLTAHLVEKSTQSISGEGCVPEIAVSEHNLEQSTANLRAPTLTNGPTKVSGKASETGDQPSPLLHRIQDESQTNVSGKKPVRRASNTGDREKASEVARPRVLKTNFPRDVWSFNLEQRGEGVLLNRSTTMKRTSSLILVFFAHS